MNQHLLFLGVLIKPKSLVILAHKLKKCFGLEARLVENSRRLGDAECMKMIVHGWLIFVWRSRFRGVDHGADYRALTINGEYIWIRDMM